jgi:hypothetical protein
MRIARTIVIPAVLTLGVAGSLLAGTAIPAAAQHPASVHVVAAAPTVYYHG